MNNKLKVLLPVAVLVVSAVLVFALFLTKQPPVKRSVKIKPPLVDVFVAQPRDTTVLVYTRGTVAPEMEIDLTAEVTGQVIKVSTNFVNGGFFNKGDVLVEVDPLKYDVEISRAKANVAQAFQAKVQAEAEMRARTSVKGKKSDLASGKVQYEKAVAQFESAKAELHAAKRTRQRTKITAPFDGRVRIKGIDVGQYVSSGMSVGSIYSVNAVEIRLPLTDKQLSLTNIPLRSVGSGASIKGSQVTLVNDYGDRKYYWQGRIVRSEGGVDEKNRLLYVIARVENPYGLDPSQPERPPLTPGVFVDAEIEGKRYDNVVVVPRKAVTGGNRLWLVAGQDKLFWRDIDVLHKGKESIYVRSGVEPGERIVTSQLNFAVNGMTVRTKSEGQAVLMDEVAEENDSLVSAQPDGSLTENRFQPPPLHTLPVQSPVEGKQVLETPVVQAPVEEQKQIETKVAQAASEGKQTVEVPVEGESEAKNVLAETEAPKRRESANDGGTSGSQNEASGERKVNRFAVVMEELKKELYEGADVEGQSARMDSKVDLRKDFEKVASVL